jgi:predicted HTH transcriptional regulator
METSINIKKEIKKTGRFKTLEEAVAFKNAELMKVLEGVDLTKLSRR